MTDKTPTIAMAHAPASASKTALIGLLDDLVTGIDAAVTSYESGDSQRWTLAVSGTPTGGTYTITLTDSINGARTTAPLAFNASEATVQAALRLLAGTGVSLTTVSATGSTPNFTHTIQFKGTRAAITVTASAAGLTGGSPVLTPTQTVAYAELGKLEAKSAVVLKGSLINWAEDLASNLRAT